MHNITRLRSSPPSPHYRQCIHFHSSESATVPHLGVPAPIPATPVPALPIPPRTPRRTAPWCTRTHTNHAGTYPAHATLCPAPYRTLVYLSSTPRRRSVSTRRLMSLLEWVSYRSAYSMASRTASRSRVFSEFSSR